MWVWISKQVPSTSSPHLQATLEFSLLCNYLTSAKQGTRILWPAKPQATVRRRISRTICYLSRQILAGEDWWLNSQAPVTKCGPCANPVRVMAPQLPWKLFRWLAPEKPVRMLETGREGGMQLVWLQLLGHQSCSLLCEHLKPPNIRAGGCPPSTCCAIVVLKQDFVLPSTQLRAPSLLIEVHIYTSRSFGYIHRNLQCARPSIQKSHV